MSRSMTVGRRCMVVWPVVGAQSLEVTRTSPLRTAPARVQLHEVASSDPGRLVGRLGGDEPIEFHEVSAGVAEFIIGPYFWPNQSVS